MFRLTNNTVMKMMACKTYDVMIVRCLKYESTNISVYQVCMILTVLLFHIIFKNVHYVAFLMLGSSLDIKEKAASGVSLLLT